MNTYQGAAEPRCNSDVDYSVTDNQNSANPALPAPEKTSITSDGERQKGELPARFTDLDPALRAELLAVPGTQQVLLHPSASVTYVTRWQVNVVLFGMTHIILRPEEDQK